MSSIKELASIFDRPAKTEEQKKDEKRHNNVHKMVRSYQDIAEKQAVSSPRASFGSPTHKENTDKQTKPNMVLPGASAITEGYRPASPTSKPQFRLP